MVWKCDFSAFLASFKISFSSLHNPNYISNKLVQAYDGDTNISAISTEPASVYVEAKVDAVGKYLHLKECSVNVLTEINNVTDPTLTESFMFIENGCLMTYGAGPTASIGQFISDNFGK